jgi:hypothetical protein
MKAKAGDHRETAIRSEIDEDALTAVQEELGFFDMVRTDSAHEAVVRPLRGSVIRRAAANSERWRTVGSQFAPLYRELRDGSLDETVRTELLLELGRGVQELDSSSEVRWAGLFESEDDEDY